MLNQKIVLPVNIENRSILIHGNFFYEEKTLRPCNKKPQGEPRGSGYAKVLKKLRMKVQRVRP